ncbi:unnamed protein product [Discula destructiva]
MRRLALATKASIPYQLRQTSLCYSSPCSTPQSWLLARRHDRARRLSTSARLGQAGAPVSEVFAGGSSSSSSSSSSYDGPEHDRQASQQPKDRTIPALPKLPYRFETGISLFAKRAPRPFPPPFLSPPSGSFSDPLSTHHRSRDRRPKVNGELIKGWTNGDDAVFASEYFIGANDGVGAWSARPRGHAGLWARLILHFWATAMSEDAGLARPANTPYTPDPVAYLQRAYEQTLEATGAPDWQGTTTATGAQLFYDMSSVDGQEKGHHGVAPMLYITNLGDSQVMVVRPSSSELVFKTTEQWHWFDCPRQLGTNSPDTPTANAILDKVPTQEGDVVLAMSDGVIDNLWSHEIVENVSASIKKWKSGEVKTMARWPDETEADGPMAFVAQELMLAAKCIALDPFAESPFMEHAIEEGLPSEGGKLDDISVVAARIVKSVDD